MSVPKFKKGTIFVGDPPIKLYLTCPICHKKAEGTMVITFAKENDPDSMFLPPQVLKSRCHVALFVEIL